MTENRQRKQNKPLNIDNSDRFSDSNGRIGCSSTGYDHYEGNVCTEKAEERLVMTTTINGSNPHLKSNNTSPLPTKMAKRLVLPRSLDHNKQSEGDFWEVAEYANIIWLFWETTEHAINILSNVQYCMGYNIFQRHIKFIFYNFSGSKNIFFFYPFVLVNVLWCGNYAQT